ncbi:MAG TPA: VanZ family protein [Candidatus Binatia bacterium]|nr:VanZ family protein [Candidatus Binatia bacterium]
MRLPRLAAPLAWTALIAWLSTDQWSGAQTGSLLLPWLPSILHAVPPDLLAGVHWLIRKLAHLTEYGVLAALWAWALAGIRAPVRWTAVVMLSLATACLDELHQATTATRTGSAADVLIDGLGIGAALVLVGRGLEVGLRQLTGLLLWIAAGGGTALLALSVAAGAPGGWLWLTTPAAALALWWRRQPARTQARR